MVDWWPKRGGKGAPQGRRAAGAARVHRKPSAGTCALVGAHRVPSGVINKRRRGAHSAGRGQGGVGLGVRGA